MIPRGEVTLVPGVVLVPVVVVVVAVVMPRVVSRVLTRVMVVVMVVVVAAVAAAGRAVRRAAAAAVPRFLLPTAGFDRGTSRLVPRARAVRDGAAAEARQAPVVFAPRVRAPAAKIRVPLRPRRPAVGRARRRRVDDVTTDHLVRVRSLAIGRVARRAVEGGVSTPARSVRIRAVAAFPARAGTHAVGPRLGGRRHRLAPHLRDELLEEGGGGVHAAGQDGSLPTRGVERLSILRHEKNDAAQRGVLSRDLHGVAHGLGGIVDVVAARLLGRDPEQPGGADGPVALLPEVVKSLQDALYAIHRLLSRGVALGGG